MSLNYSIISKSYYILRKLIIKNVIPINSMLNFNFHNLLKILIKNAPKMQVSIMKYKHLFLEEFIIFVLRETI